MKRLVSWREEISGIVVHPLERSRYREEILEEVRGLDIPVLDAKTLADPAGVEALAKLSPDLGLSVYYGYILRPSVLELFPRGVLNLHPALLPFNRGAHPNVWSIIEETPAGVTLHFMDEGVDTGDIVMQKPVAVDPCDTGGSLYAKLEEAAIGLFEEAWPQVRRGAFSRQAQAKHEGTFHRVSDLQLVDRIDLERSYRAKDLLNLLRARTFPPYRGAYFEVDGRRIYVRVELEEA